MLDVLMKRWRDKLCCPVCSGRPALQAVPAEGQGEEANPQAFRCESCKREYPVIEGIPHIIASSAKIPGAELPSPEVAATPASEP